MSTAVTGMTRGGVRAVHVRRGGWLAASRLVDHALTFAARALAARWLGPEEFGRFGVALLVLTIVEALSETGVNVALVQRAHVDRRQVDAAWTIGVVRAILTAAFIVLLAPFVSAWFDAPDAEGLVLLLAPLVLLRASASPGTVMLERDLEFRRLAVVRVVRSVLCITATLVAARVLEDASALLIGVIVAELGRVVASYGMAPWRPHLVWDRRLYVELLRYGRWVTGSSIALLGLLYLDDVLVGAMLGASVLAVYQLAYQFAGMPATELSHVITEVTFPIFSRLADDRVRLRSMFLRTYEFVATVAVPLTLALAFTADDLVAGLLGPSWSDAPMLIRLLAGWGLLRALGALTSSLLRSVDRPETVARQHLAMLVLTASALWPAIKVWGAPGAAAAVLVPNLVVHVARYRPVTDALDVSIDRVLRLLVVPLVSGLAMAAVMTVVATVLHSYDAPSLVSAAVTASVGAVAYVAALAANQRLGNTDLLGDVRALATAGSA